MNKNIIFPSILLLAGTLACSLPIGVTPTPIVITQVVVVPNEQQQTQASATLSPATIPSSTGTDTPSPSSTATITGTYTPVHTATNVPTATSSGPIATFVLDANCRSGPGTAYPVVTSFFKGETVRIIGRNPNFSNTWWYVIVPSTGGRCWVSLTTAQAYGDFDEIPTVVP